jgi:release factor glutamine methyltransferase
MKIIDFYFYILNEIRLLTNNKIEAEAEAELIFGSKKFKEYFGKSLNKIDIFATYSNSILKKDVISYFNEILKKRSKGIPIQYILDEAWFYGHEFHVYENNINKALIPRNETELIVESFIKETKNNEFNSIYALDIGTGSGCIPISILLNSNKNIYFDAIDPYSFKIAKKNISRYKLKSQISLHKIGLDNISNIFTKKYDFVTANLPYIPEDNIINELRYEPSEALYASDKGLFLIKNLIEILPKIIKENGLAFIEIDPEQSYFFKSLKNFSVEIKKDYNNFERLVILSPN